MTAGAGSRSWRRRSRSREQAAGPGPGSPVRHPSRVEKSGSPELRPNTVALRSLARLDSQAEGFVYSSNLSAAFSLLSSLSLLSSWSLFYRRLLLHFDCIFDCCRCWVLVQLVCPLLPPLSLLPLCPACPFCFKLHSSASASASSTSPLGSGSGQCFIELWLACGCPQTERDRETESETEQERERCNIYSRIYITNFGYCIGACIEQHPSQIPARAKRLPHKLAAYSQRPHKLRKIVQIPLYIDILQIEQNTYPNDCL